MSLEIITVWGTSLGYFFSKEDAMKKKNRSKDPARWGCKEEYEMPREFSTLTDGTRFFYLDQINVR